MAKTSFLKIVYFDESFVADFMQISAGGELKRTTEFVAEVNAEVEVDGDVKASVNEEKKGLPKLFSFLSGIEASANGGISGEIAHKKDRIVKNILENTLLADFVALLEADERRSNKNKKCEGIKIFKNITVRPGVNSLTYFMLIAPFFNILEAKIPLKGDDGQDMFLDLTKIEESIEKGRGYYEFIATIEGKEVVLRFNRSAFRNNYTMSDLPKMQLTFYAIRVGEIDKTDLSAEKEFEFGTSQVSQRINYSDLNNQTIRDSKAEVYDVVLAGVVK